MKKDTVSISEKINLSLEEAAAYFNIGVGKLRELSNSEDCPFVLWVGNRRLIKRKKFEAFLDAAYSI
ncbi:MAG: excisionase [Faecousia sp.]